MLREIMTVLDYLKKLVEICHYDDMSEARLVRKLDICHNTLFRIRRRPESCSKKTLSKIKVFVAAWEHKNKNMSAGD
jgi:hypothetical protein